MIFPPIQVAQASPESLITSVLDDLNLAAAQSDEARYFDHLDDSAVFLGTDATERWTKAQFKAYAHPFFAQKRAWSFRSVRRVITVSRDGNTAWFDEDLATPNLGPCRGSGVLVKRGGVWRIVQYNLALTIPNALVDEVKARLGEAQPDGR